MVNHSLAPYEESILILDFGGQYTQLIARRVRDLGVYSHVLPYHASLEDIRSCAPRGIILSGGPASVLEEGAPRCDSGVYTLGVPVLGICYGMQLTAVVHGGKVEKAAKREYGRIRVQMDQRQDLLKDMPSAASSWMSHTYQVTGLPEGFSALAHTADCPVAAMAHPDKGIYCVQFHPEVTHSEQGTRVLQNFLQNICHCKAEWSMQHYAETAIEAIRQQVGPEGTVLLALSGGVDSSVVAALLYKAIGDRLTCVFVDHGFMRMGEPEAVKNVFGKNFPANLIAVDASDEFFADLAGVTDPEQKRKIIGRDFLQMFTREAKKLGKLDYFAQGTIYPDVIESGEGAGSAVIKSHHNVGGLPKELGFTELVEPLRMLFKDEVRRLGDALGLPHDMVWRQPFPGPGLAIRVMGEVTREKVDIVRRSDRILRDEIKAAGLDGQIHQYFTVLTGIKTVGVQGDERTYDYTLAIRAVTTDDFMTADWARIPYDTLAHISSRITNEVAHVNRVVLDVTTKPPASIEWE